MLCFQASISVLYIDQWIYIFTFGVAKARPLSFDTCEKVEVTGRKQGGERICGGGDGGSGGVLFAAPVSIQFTYMFINLQA